MELKTKEINGAECLYYNPSGLQKESTYDFRKISVYGLSPAVLLWGIERSGFFNGREKWAKGFENQRV